VPLGESSGAHLSERQLAEDSHVSGVHQFPQPGEDL